MERRKDHTQVCVWPGTVVQKCDNPTPIEEFEDFFIKNFDTRVQYIEEIVTDPDTKDGVIVEETGGRTDVFFAIHKDDIGKFAIKRLELGIRWIEDVLAPCNYRCPIYPERVFEYKTWSTET